MVEYAKGDVVRLKSGGPNMTIAGSSSAGQVICQWFVGGEIKANTFPPEVLIRVPNENLKGPDLEKDTDHQEQ